MNSRLFSFVRRKSGVRWTSGLAVKEDAPLSEGKVKDHELQVISGQPSPNLKKQLYVWGLAEHGALGLENVDKKHFKKTFKYRQKPVRHFFGERNNVILAECGYGFTVFSVTSKSESHKVFGCGLNTDSQLGCQETRPGHPLSLLLCPVPVNLGICDPNTQILAISAGRAHTVVVTDKEGVYTLGSNCYGQCGRPVIPDENYSYPGYIHNIKTLGESRVVSSVCGQDHTLFLDEEGKVWFCGWSADGQSGLGIDENVSTPARVAGDISTERIVKVVGKCDSILALSDKGHVFGWGNSEYGQLTDGDDERTVIPCPTFLEKLKPAGKIVDIAAGGSFCMALNEEGDVFVWGYGILGAGPSVDMSVVPVALPKTLFGLDEFQPDTKVTSIACGLSHLAAITNYCNLYTWGRNRNGCLGVGHVRDQYFPYKVCIGASVEQVSCGLDHTSAICTPYV